METTSPRAADSNSSRLSSRRALITAMAAWPVLATVPASVAQRPGTFRVGWISLDRSDGSPFLEPLRAGLRDLGYVEGRNLVIDARWAEGSGERLAPLAADLVRANPQVIVTQGPSVFWVLKTETNIPVVFGFSGDPVDGKLVESLSRPGRNATGMTFLSLELVGKRVELLKELLPGLKRIAIIARPEHPGEQGELRASETAANKLGLAVSYLPVRGGADVDVALIGVLKSRSDAIVVFPDAVMMRHSEQVAAFAEKHRIPAVSGWSQFADGGNVITYGPVLRDGFRRLAYFVDRILKGAKPVDLPVELPTSVELVINLKAARALGLTIPQSIRVRADRVIE